MKKILFLIIVSLWSFSAQATTEEHFNACVKMKDMTLAIAAAADKNVSREELKNRVDHHESVSELIDLVFDFRGVMSNQDIAKRQMANCLALEKK